MTPFDTIEGLIDKYDVANVLRMVRDVMQEKAEHIIANWQDEKLAKEWVKGVAVVEVAIKKIAKSTRD